MNVCVRKKNMKKARHWMPQLIGIYSNDSIHGVAFLVFLPGKVAKQNDKREGRKKISYAFTAMILSRLRAFFFFSFTIASLLVLHSMNSDAYVVSEAVILLLARAQMTGNVRNRRNLIMRNMKKKRMICLRATHIELQNKIYIWK